MRKIISFMHISLDGFVAGHKNAILMMETVDKKTAIKLLDTLPLVKSGKIKFEVIELRPYTGYERIMR